MHHENTESTDTPIEVAVVVLGYRARSLMEAGTLASTIAAARRIGRPTRIIYLDNYSRDGSVQWIAEHHKEVDLLLAPFNSLYCVGNNILLQYTHRRYRPTYYILADADNYVEPDAFRSLVGFADAHPRCGLVQPLVRSRSDSRQLYSCGHRYTADHWCRTLTELPEDRSTLMDLPSCSIASTLVRAAVFETCGVLNPVYEIYYESSDLSFRARAAGWTCACDTSAVAYNEPTTVASADSMHNFAYFNRNRLVFWRLHDPAIFRVVEAEAHQTLATLNNELAATRFGLSPERESVRRGLEAGLRLASDPDVLTVAPPSIAAFQKTSAVLLQEGTLV
jgi:GT2 family glycosyltransferase